MVKKSDESLPAEIGAEQFAIMKMEKDGIKELMAENFGSEAINLSDLTTITVPTGGATTWTISTIDGDVETKEIIGIMIYTRMTRTWWETSFEDSGGGVFPDCFSLDALHGIGKLADHPGVDGICKKCPMDAMGTGKDGIGKACKEKRQIFMVLQDEVLPVLLRVPVMSVGPSRKYLLGLTSHQKPIHSVYTKFSLETDKNKKGIKYSKIKFEKIGEVENPVHTKAYAEAIKPYLEEISEQMVRNASPADDTSFDTDTFA
jgi:hypothetical protein